MQFFERRPNDLPGVGKLLECGSAARVELLFADHVGIPIAFLFGWLFFGEAPIRGLLLGAILMVVGGLMVIWQERQLGHRTRASIFISEPDK